MLFNPVGLVMTTWRHLSVYKLEFGVLGKMENFGTLPEREKKRRSGRLVAL